MSDDSTSGVIVLDQFSGPTPNALAQQPLPWSEFVANVHAGKYTVGWRVPEHTTVGDLERSGGLRIASTAYRCGANGFVEVWRVKWDTSG